MNWKKLALYSLNVVLGAYLVLAMTAFNNPEERANVCSEVRIRMEEGLNKGFLTTDRVRQLLADNHIDLVGQQMKDINTRNIETMLLGNALIEEAECYLTQTGHVCINIKQRTPVVRVMNERGDDYCVDSNGKLMAKPDLSCDLIIATGAINTTYAQQILAPAVKDIIANDLWNSQVVQLNVLKDGSVEMVPRVGQHIIYLGQPVDIAAKLNRLTKFYRYGLSRTGWNKYSRISVEFDNQIICKRKNNK